MKRNKYLFLLILIPLLAIVYIIVNYHKITFQGKIGLVTLGKSKPEQVQLIKKEIEKFYGFSVYVIPGLTLPEEAYYQPRNRYKADLLLNYLAEIKPAQQDKIIALIQKDISVKTDTHEDWGIMGLAWLGGSCCVVSTFRLGKDKPVKQKFNERLTKVALHEVGHTLGLAHCDQSVSCLMNDAKGLVNTIDKEQMTLCKYCQQQIAYTKN